MNVITTTALSNSVNLPNLRLVLHLPSATFGLKDFGQESGLLSRNHEAWILIVCVSESQRVFFQNIAAAPFVRTVKQLESRAMAQYVLATACRRLILSRHFDSQDLSCSDRAVSFNWVTSFADSGMFTAQLAIVLLLGCTSLCLCRGVQRPTAPFCTSGMSET